MDQYKSYLAAEVLSEGHIVTYRLLSRAVKVHVNLAKQMLYDFAQNQNAKKADSIHVTYLLSGKQRITAPAQPNGTHEQDGEDTVMRSSPFVSSMPENDNETNAGNLVASITLVGAEDLERIKQTYEEISCIHVYSLEPGPLKDPQLLSACNQSIVAKQADQNPLEAWKLYGTIHNPHAKRRTGRRPPPQASAPAAATAAPKSTQPKNSAPSKSISMPKKSEGISFNKSTPQSASTSSSQKTETKPSALKREKSDIFKSFAKAKTKPKQEAPATTESTQQSNHEDETMKDASEDEQEEDFALKPAKELSEAERKARDEREEKERAAKAQREEALRKMMDEEDDEPMNDVPDAAAAEEEEEVDKGTPLDTPQTAPVSENAEAEVSVSSGRRRGKRRVMKKKTVKDEEGYLVTKEEAVWESFSEDEPEPKKVKAAAPSSSMKAKKGGKQAQGNIMSFFTKK